MMKRHLILFFTLTLLGCTNSGKTIQTEFTSSTCIRPLIGYHYLTCKRINFFINRKAFSIPANFETDLASIPRVAWFIISPAHSSLIQPAIVHDWFYRKSCDFNRLETDLIFYHMLRNNGVP